MTASVSCYRGLLPVHLSAPQPAAEEEEAFPRLQCCSSSVLSWVQEESATPWVASTGDAAGNVYCQRAGAGSGIVWLGLDFDWHSPQPILPARWGQGRLCLETTSPSTCLTMAALGAAQIDLHFPRRHCLLSSTSCTLRNPPLVFA